MSDKITDFDKLWDYSNPQKTELKFRNLLSQADLNLNTSYYLQLQTQLARTLGLQQRFDEAHALLDEVESHLSDDMDLVWIRYFLERGRTFRSDGQVEKSIDLFIRAYDISLNKGYDFLTVDAAHMLGVAETPEKQIMWNEKAIEIAENSSSERARNWLGSLYNNLAWTYHDLSEYTKALDLFKRGLAFREEQGKLENILIAKWTIARTYRSLNRIDEAIELQHALLKEYEDNNIQPAGYGNEELGELYLIKGEKEKSAKNFKIAYDKLSKDIWLVKNEPERLERLKSLSSIN